MANLQKWVDQYPVLGLVGNTPLVKLNIFRDEFPHVSIYTKCEYVNPGGSIKDRPVRHMLLHALDEGRLTPQKTILDSSSGNAGIALASIGSLLGYHVELVVPGSASLERKKRIRAHGATIIETDPAKGYDAAPREARERFKANPEKYFMPDQYGNPDNWKSHYETTAVEIIEQLPEKPTHFVSGVGTGGTITGCGRRLKEHYKNIEVVLADVDPKHGIEGLKCLGPGDFVPEILDESVIDRKIFGGLPNAIPWCKQLAQQGLFLGQSSGFYLHACHALAKEIKKGVIVTLLCDIGERYFSTHLWD